ncbi:hypothetical protein EDC51_106129 [Bibersteinia trehalosi]|uniref:hypothetical protein n=1 Tax=Bibersteinia trehalosi TaxID=47735 RepID=UPI0010521F22|nr:hypothetical protein [Bibersteinia trehalosi]TCT15218.1 hypothetical protein EDC51_106129 [Bibersteinia trehalosi]
MSKISITERSNYGPIRFEARYSFLNDMFNVARKKIVNREKDSYKFVGNWIEKNLDGNNLELILNVEVFTRFLASGKIIYELDPSLFKALVLTDVDNIPCSLFNLAYNTFYIQLGGYSNVFDGVYIDKWSSSEDVNGNEDSIDLVFVYKNYAKKKVSINNFFEEKLNIVTLDISDPNAMIKDVFQDEIMSSFYMHYLISKERNMLDDEQTQIFLQKEQSENNEMALLLPLIVNLILYISSYNSDVINDWSSDTPKEKISKLQKTTNSAEQKNVENGLLDAGYSKVKYLGKNFAKSKEATLLLKTLEGGRTLSTHFRRGHFRNQHYGKNNSLRKIIFIAPTVVNEGGEIQGRIIEVGNRG